MTITLSMICKGELKNLQRLKPLVEDYINEWVVVLPPNDEAEGWCKENGIVTVVKDFTQPIEKKYIKLMREWGLEVEDGYRLFNFAAARNESFSKATSDYILWLDADDAPIGLEGLKSLMKGKEKADYFNVEYDYARDTEGNSISDHVRERIIRNDKRFTWRGGKLGLIHETITPDPGFTPTKYTFTKDEFYVLHNSDHADESSYRNHRALLYEYLKTKGEDARTTYYLGTEYFNRKMYGMCIKIMQEYIKTGGWDEERYRAWLRIAESYHQLDDKESSRNAYLAAIKELPNYPDAYHGIGESYHSDGEYGKAIEFIRTGLQKPLPPTQSALNYVKYTFRPATFLALAYLKLGKTKEAVEWYSRAAKMNPKEGWVREYADLFDEVNDLDRYVKAFVELGRVSKKRYPKTLHALAEAIPDELKDQELLLAFKRTHTKPKIWGPKSVVFFCSEAFEEWGPDSLERGTGGSEEAVIQLTKRFAEQGYEVTVFNNCPEEKTVNGVKWVRFERFNPRDLFNVLISWRNNPFIDNVVANKKFIDVHDVPTLQYFAEKYVQNVTLLVKSKYHRSLFSHLKDDQFKIINNGINPEQFNSGNKVKNNLVWTSSYDRGLEYLLEMWPDVKKEVPDATLDIAYGFGLFDTSPRGRTKEGQAWKNKMLKLMDQDGVTHHGRVNTHEVAELYNKADVWAYPTDFPEIDCITATKAMAAKCVPITTDFAVMKERNQGVMVEGQDHEKFKQELVRLLKDEDRKQEIRDKLDVSKFGWDSVAERWMELF